MPSPTPEDMLREAALLRAKAAQAGKFLPGPVQGRTGAVLMVGVRQGLAGSMPCEGEGPC